MAQPNQHMSGDIGDDMDETVHDDVLTRNAAQWLLVFDRSSRR
jgi:hypothetical protein